MYRYIVSANHTFKYSRMNRSTDKTLHEKNVLCATIATAIRGQDFRTVQFKI